MDAFFVPVCKACVFLLLWLCGGYLELYLRGQGFKLSCWVNEFEFLGLPERL
ncbi:MAG: hypothetical protein R3Y46_01940 [Opitutales bacterium]